MHETAIEKLRTFPIRRRRSDGAEKVAPMCGEYWLVHLATQNIAIFVKLDTVGSLATYFAEDMRLTDKTTPKLAVGIARERLAI